MDHLLSFAFLLLGLAVGGGAAWLLLRGKVQHAFDRGKAEGEGERIALGERLAAREQTIDGLNSQVRQFQEKTDQQQTAESKSQAKLAQLAAILDQERKQTAEKLGLLNHAQKSWPTPSRPSPPRP